MSAERLPWFRCVPSALLGALAGMEPGEGYIYVALLLRIYETGGPVAETPRTLARRTGLTERKASAALALLIEAGKVVSLDDGRLDSETTHAELEFQRSSREQQSAAGKSSAAKRAKKSQQKQQNTSTSVDRPFNHLDLDKREVRTGSLRSPVLSDYDDEFERFWRVFPRRAGTSSRKGAHDKFVRLRRAGVSAAEMQRGAQNYAAEQADLGNSGTPYVKAAEAWLNKELWRDYQQPRPSARGSPPSQFGPVIDHATGDLWNNLDAQRTRQDRTYSRSQARGHDATLAAVASVFGRGTD